MRLSQTIADDLAKNVEDLGLTYDEFQHQIHRLDDEQLLKIRNESLDNYFTLFDIQFYDSRIEIRESLPFDLFVTAVRRRQGCNERQ